MKHIKRYGVGIFALLSLLSVLFVTSSPTSISGQTATTAAADAAVNIRWETGSAQTPANPAIFTIEYEENNCDAPIGGTLHRAATGSRSDAAFGSDNGENSILPTHLNFAPTSTSSQSADRCDYTLRVTASLNCAFTVAFDDAAGGVDPQVALTVARESTNQPSQGTLEIQGQNLAAVVTNFFAASTNTDIAPSATGRLTYTNTDGEEVDIRSSSGQITGTVTATTCDAPVRSGGFAVSNAEPVGSLDLAFNMEPRGGCRPDGTFGQISLSSGRPENVRRYSFDDDCTYDLSADHSPNQEITNLNSGKSQCEVEAILYEVDSSGDLNTSIARVSADAIRVNVDSTGGFVSRIDSHDIVRVVLFITDNCPETASISLRYEVLDGTDASVGLTDIQATIAPTSGSHVNCSARPARVTLEGASDDRISLDASQRVSIVVRPLRGGTCSYTISYPINSGPLNLVGEPGNNYKSGSGTTTSISLPSTGAVVSSDGRLDGSWTASAISLRTDPNVSFIYQVRRIPISVTVEFPTDAIFTTQDQTRHDINVIGACAQFLPIVSRALGTSVRSRTQRALPGTSLIYDPSLRLLINPNSQAGEALYEIEPVVIVDGVAQPCEIEVSERETPAGCQVTGGATQTQSFAEGLTSFEFVFEHTCGTTRVPEAPTDSGLDTVPIPGTDRVLTG